MSKFNNCLNQGKFYELETLKYIKYDTYNISKGIFKEWDIEAYQSKVPIYYEVKSETNAFKYGNLCIEFKCNNKDSGVNATIADYWVHYAIKSKELNIYDLFIIPIMDLRQMIIDKKYNRIIKGGDGKRSECYIFNMKTFNEYIIKQII
tara:strand:- start:1532 stop:1978 length:447 start_codon:yes stop_codon:yes gene_type:complete